MSSEVASNKVANELFRIKPATDIHREQVCSSSFIVKSELRHTVLASDILRSEASITTLVTNLGRKMLGVEILRHATPEEADCGFWASCFNPPRLRVITQKHTGPAEEIQFVRSAALCPRVISRASHGHDLNQAPYVLLC